MGLDPTFGYYQTFTWPEHAKHLKDAGFTGVDVIIVNLDTPHEKQNEIIEAFHDAGMECVMRIFPETEPRLFSAYPEWRQIMLGGGSQHDWRVYLCPNNADFARTYCSLLDKTLRACPYDGIQLAESWFEVWGGSYPDNVARDKYACLCASCRVKFRTFAKVDPKELFEANSKHYFLKDENKDLYQKWIDFRVDSIIEFNRRVLDTAKKARRGIFTDVMYLSDCMHKPGGVREFQAQDLERIVKDLNPDAISIQDAWQEWCKSGLKPSFIQAYGKEYIPRIRNIKPDMVVHSHADIGSLPASKRSPQWIEEFRKESVAAGFNEATFYEWSVSKLAPRSD